MRRDYSNMPGWTMLSGDRDWSGVRAMWYKKAPDGTYFVVIFENMREYDEGAVERGEWDEFNAEVKSLNLQDLDPRELKSALDSCGWRWDPDGIIRNDYDNEPLVNDKDESLIVALDVCLRYGLGCPLWSDTATGHPLRLRAAARREAESLMNDPDALDELLDRPVNKIGSTAREFGAGNIQAAFDRIRATEDPDPARQLAARLQGGTITTVRQATLLKCPFTIMVPEHYRKGVFTASGQPTYFPEPGKLPCLCSNAEHRKFMIAEWEYSKANFANIPLED